MRRFNSVYAVAGLALAAATLGGADRAQAEDMSALLEARCASCHDARADGTLERVHDARKTPEAWDMTLARMMVVHGIDLTSDERRKLVKHLADSRGLAPSEGRAYRYILEKTPGVTDAAPDEMMTQMCARCHSFARVALQRRDREEWLRLVHFHLGQYPTTEYQALGRDRDWWGIARTEMVDALAKMFPFESDAWTGWQARKAPDLSGTWRVVGRQPGKGAYDGTLTVTAKGDDAYAVESRLRFADGRTVSRAGNAVLYTGHEWRAGLKGADGSVRQVATVAEDGRSMTGRWFLRDNDVIGGSLTAMRVDAGPRVLAVAPGHIKQGGTARLTIMGVGLAGEPDLGAGLEAKVVERSADRIALDVTAAKDAPVGGRNVKIGGAALAGGLIVYDKVARVAVVPEQTYARVGGNKGPIAPMPAQFEAIGYMAGPDGKAGTDDDVEIGPMAADWSTDDFDELAAAMKDAKFAGRITQAGLFEPAAAGPNPARPKSTNNAGNLAVVATVEDAGRKIEGRAQLFVTVQRFVDPPIR